MREWIRSHWFGATVGTVLALGTAALFWSGPFEDPYAQHAILLAAIGAVYIGFGLADGRMQIVLVEVTAGVIFWILAALSLSVSHVLLIIGLAAHGLWDLIHHPHALSTKVPTWYPPFCAVYDWVLAGTLVLMMLVKSNS